MNLAVVTLGFAAAADVTLVQIQFPGSADGTAIERPEMFSNDREFFFLSIVVLAVCALGVFFLQRGRWGRAGRPWHSPNGEPPPRGRACRRPS